jgi:hypothetical protein
MNNFKGNKAFFFLLIDIKIFLDTDPQQPLLPNIEVIGQ